MAAVLPYWHQYSASARRPKPKASPLAKMTETSGEGIGTLDRLHLTRVRVQVSISGGLYQLVGSARCECQPPGKLSDLPFSAVVDDKTYRCRVYVTAVTVLDGSSEIQFRSTGDVGIRFVMP